MTAPCSAPGRDGRLIFGEFQRLKAGANEEGVCSIWNGGPPGQYAFVLLKDGSRAIFLHRGAAMVAPVGLLSSASTSACLESARVLNWPAFFILAAFGRRLAPDAVFALWARLLFAISNSSHRLRRHIAPAPPKPRRGQLLGHDAAEAAAHSGEEPVSCGAYVASPFDRESGGQERSPSMSAP